MSDVTNAFFFPRGDYGAILCMAYEGFDCLQQALWTTDMDVNAPVFQILQLEKECGIKRQTTLEHVVEKLEPVKHAVVTAGSVVAKKAHELREAASEKMHARPRELHSGVVVAVTLSGGRSAHVNSFIVSTSTNITRNPLTRHSALDEA